MLKDLINKAIKKRMQELSINVVELANKVNITPQHIYNLLKDERRWNEDTLELVFKELGIEVEFKFVKKAG